MNNSFTKLAKSGEKPLATTDSSGSWMQLLNPLSFFMGGNDRYPEFMERLFGGNASAAWAASKLLAVGATSYGTGYALRTLHKRLSTDKLEDQDAGNKYVRSNLNQTDSSEWYAGGQPKKASEVPWPKALDVTGTLLTAAPLLVCALGVTGGFNQADRDMLKDKQQILGEQLEDARKELDRVILARAQQARGTLPKGQVKQAGASGRNLMAALGLLCLGVGGLAGMASYNYAKASNSNNLEYKANRKGLDMYAAARSKSTPVKLAPSNFEEYISAIEGGAPDGDNTSRLPEYEGASKPVSITI